MRNCVTKHKIKSPENWSQIILYEAVAAKLKSRPQGAIHKVWTRKMTIFRPSLPCVRNDVNNLETIWCVRFYKSLHPLPPEKSFVFYGWPLTVFRCVWCVSTIIGCRKVNIFIGLFISKWLKGKKVLYLHLRDTERHLINNVKWLSYLTKE